MSLAWVALRHLFETDDGSLPEIRVEILSGTEVVAVAGFLETIGEIRDGAAYWNRREGCESPLESVEAAADLVARGDAEPFHFNLPDPNFDGVTIPELGVFVDPDSISLDYRMGPEWGINEVEALLRILGRVRDLTPGCKIEHEDHGTLSPYLDLPRTPPTDLTRS